MPPRDELDFEQRRQQIIDGALHVFAHKGFEEATNKDIAKAAKIGSPGLIYHYFKDKADLFRQVVEQRVPMVQLLEHGDEIMEMPPREALTLVGGTFLKMVGNRKAMALVRLMLGEAIRRPMVADMIARIGPMRGVKLLSAYLELQMDKGVLRRMDPGVAARCFMGPIAAYFLTRELFVLPDAKRISPEEMLEGAVDVFLRGMEVEGKEG